MNFASGLAGSVLFSICCGVFGWVSGAIVQHTKDSVITQSLKEQWQAETQKKLDAQASQENIDLQKKLDRLHDDFTQLTVEKVFKSDCVAGQTVTESVNKTRKKAESPK